MANLPETIQWDAGVYQIEVTDKVTGGVDGIVNKAPKALANRTAYLKDRVEALDASALAQQNELALKAPLASPALTGTPTVPTAAAGTNTTQVASTAYVRTEIANLVDSAPATLDTLNELAAALGDDPNFATTVTNSLAAKAPLASPTFTGTPAGPTAAADTSTTQLASTEFVIGQAGAATPLVNGVAAVGTSKKYARDDHVHPTDTTRAPLASPAFTGAISDYGSASSSLANPGAATGVGSGTGGTLAAATYYVKIVAVDSLGNLTAAGAESAGVAVTGSTSSIAYTWTAVVGAVSYRVYYGTAAGAEAAYYTASTNAFTLVATAGTAGSPPTVNSTGAVLAKGEGGIGYGTGAGGAVTQATSKSTGVTLDKVSGSITLHNESLAANTSVAFTLTNSKIAATDVVLVSIKSGATSLAYLTQVEAVAAGSCKIVLRNVSAGALGEAVVLNFAVIKAVAA